MAEVHGKLSEETSSIETKEDVLTSNVFQCLRYMEPKNGIIPFLNEVFNENQRDLESEIKLDPDQEWKIEYTFWPKGVEIGREPDLLIQLSSNEIKYTVVVEAKYKSGPSDKEDVDEESEKQYGNQLSDQFIDLLKGKYRTYDKTIYLECDRKNRFLLYLTKNSTKPKIELKSAVDQFQQNFPESKIDIRKHLLWINWTRIWSVLRKYPNDDFPFKLIRNDLISLLERKGFKEFSGFKVIEWEKKYKSFYKELWFKALRDDFFDFIDENPNFFKEEV
jgi:hypothetical protein